MSLDHAAALPREQKTERSRSVRVRRRSAFGVQPGSGYPPTSRGTGRKPPGTGLASPVAARDGLTSDRRVMSKSVLVLMIEAHRLQPRGLAALVEAQLGHEVVAAAEGFHPGLVEAVRKAAPVTLDAFLETVRAVAAADEPPSRLPDAAMTKREREIRQLIAEGLSNKEIASRLEIATETVKGHVHNILEKLGLRTRLQVAAHAHRERALTVRGG